MRSKIYDGSAWPKLKKVVFYGAAAFVAINLFLQTPYRIGVDIQRLIGEPSCLPETFVFLDLRVRKAPEKGDYVVALMPDTKMSVGAKAGIRIVKKVLATEGDQIKISGADFWVNGEHAGRLWLGKSIPGKQLGDFDKEYILKENEFFLFGTEKESFDSRYWGAIDGSKIIGFSYPLI